MIALKFHEFYEGEFQDLGYELYFVKDLKEQAMYIGISRGPIWRRWFGATTSHLTIGFNGELHGASHIGQVIERNLPFSRDWTIELWTKTDCLEYLTKEFAGKEADKVNIKDLESALIGKFNPLYNVMHGGGYHEDPLDTKRLDDEYRKIFK